MISPHPVPLKYSKVSLIFRIPSFAIVFTLFCAGISPVYASRTCATKVTLLKDREYFESLLKSIRDARKSILLSCYLFKVTPTYQNQPGRIAEELIEAKDRGLDVTVILEISDDADDPLNAENRQTASFLARKGIKVLFDSPRKKTHLKAALIDDRYVFIGSHNLTQSALKHNNEVSVLVDSPEIASEMRSYLKRLVTK